ncbi:hypothetical protein Skr01_63870 [Sphaerisporangium krabiense]|uniref:Citronellyl-CoA dehydrogenase n=1 Tax=Sphaerisporangium krabiense TaxID=763782 RepID=A0A7W8Z6U5_9ACTN|nr:acyl-CoA dehydrogenase [Sphaerisporangium krabiense]MBB5628305.1 citronellyl-CoA dehydrogenase [Sphaerisporangium krabiense]GII66302.1 hypothetical protein Skr01_63870 [Sphaerisporangium krabiense]
MPDTSTNPNPLLTSPHREQTRAPRPDPRGTRDTDVAAVVRELPVDASAAVVWRALGAAGLICGVYRDGGRPRVEPAALRRLLAALDDRLPVGATLGVCVQLATALPLLGQAADLCPPAAAALPAVSRGEDVVALAATDAGPGSDLTALATTAEIGADHVVLNGRKRWITNAATARHLLVLARHRPGGHFTDFTWVLVPADAPGVTIRPAGTTLFGAAGIGHVHLDGVRLPRSHVAGRVGHGLAVFARHIATERLAGALWGVALCRRALAGTADRLDGRALAGGTLGRHPVVRDRLARATVRLHALDALCRVHGEAVARDGDTVAAALLKAAVAETVEHVLADCAHLQGADGFAEDGAQTLRAQAGVFGVGGGTTEVVLGLLADNLPALLNRIRPT